MTTYYSHNPMQGIVGEQSLVGSYFEKLTIREARKLGVGSLVYVFRGEIGAIADGYSQVCIDAVDDQGKGKKFFRHEFGGHSSESGAIYKVKPGKSLDELVQRLPNCTKAPLAD